MRAHVAMTLAALTAAAMIAGCAAKGDWVRTRDDAPRLKSALYWCSKVQRDKFYKHGADASAQREKNVTIDEKCMRERGWRRGS